MFQTFEIVGLEQLVSGRRRTRRFMAVSVPRHRHSASTCQSRFRNYGRRHLVVVMLVAIMPVAIMIVIV